MRHGGACSYCISRAGLVPGKPTVPLGHPIGEQRTGKLSDGRAILLAPTFHPCPALRTRSGLPCGPCGQGSPDHGSEKTEQSCGQCNSHEALHVRRDFHAQFPSRSPYWMITSLSDFLGHSPDQHLRRWPWHPDTAVDRISPSWPARSGTQLARGQADGIPSRQACTARPPIRSLPEPARTPAAADAECRAIGLQVQRVRCGGGAATGFCRHPGRHEPFASCQP